MKRVIYPGSFDPVHYGHIDIIKRSAEMFDEVIVSVLDNKSKSPLFLVEERVKMLNEVLCDIPNVKVESFGGLLVDYCKEKESRIVIRGIRAITDFEYELQTAQINAKLSDDYVDTLLLPTNLQYTYLSSSAVKEIAKFNGDISKCVPDCIAEALFAKLNAKMKED